MSIIRICTALGFFSVCCNSFILSTSSPWLVHSPATDAVSCSRFSPMFVSKDYRGQRRDGFDEYSRVGDDDEFDEDDDDDDDDEDDDDDDEEDDYVMDGRNTKSDWVEAELTLLNAPSEPSPELTPETVAQTICRSLQMVDYPTPGAGLQRCFPFFTFSCRKAVTARQGAETVEAFCQFSQLSPALQPFMGARKVHVHMGESITHIPAKPPLRGALASFPITIEKAAIYSLQYPSGMERPGIASQPPISHIVLRLEQQRRPPHQGCWLVCEVLDVRHAFAGDMGNVVGG